MKTLKTTFLFISALLIVNYSWAQAILTADNNPGAVAVAGSVFTGETALQDAIAAASANDIIHVIRSSTNYGTITIDKPLNIYGIGLDPDTEGGSLSAITQIDILDPAASGTRISGVSTGTVINLGGTTGALSNILIENSWVRRLQHTSDVTTISNLIIRNCIMGYSVGGTTEETIDLLVGFVSNIVIANNVIYGSTHRDCCTAHQGSVTTDQSTIENNIFIHGIVGSIVWFAFEDLRNSTVKNNIFYGISPQGKVTLSSNTFENNLSFNTFSDTFSTSSGNTSIGNIEGQDPLFESVSLANSTGSMTTFDPNLQSGFTSNRCRHGWK